MVIYWLGNNDWNTFVQSILYLNWNLWLNKKNNEINCSDSYIFKTEHRCRVLLVGNFPNMFQGTFFTFYVRYWDEFLEEITGFVRDLSHCCDNFLLCVTTSIFCLYVASVPITDFRRVFSAYSPEECLPYPQYHLELQKHSVFPSYLSQHGQESQSQNLEVSEPLLQQRMPSGCS